VRIVERAAGFCDLCCTGAKFNVVVFGSTWQFMSPKCEDYTEDSAAAAVAWIQTNVHANWGGTEIAGTLDAIFDVPVSDGARHRCIAVPRISALACMRW